MSWPKNTTERFEQVNTAFTNEVNAVTDWAAQTPVKEWEAKDVIMHFQGWVPAAVKTAGIDMATTVDPYDDPAGAWEELSAGITSILADTPNLPIQSGDFEGMDLEGLVRNFLINDMFMHTWDLARSQGRDPQLNEDVAEKILEGLQAQGDGLREGEAFGPEYECDPQAPAMERLMAYVGRDPNFGKA